MNVPRRSLLTAAAAVVASRPTFSAVKAISSNDLQALIDKAIEDGGVVRLPAGSIATAGLKIAGPVRLEGVPGKSKLISRDGSSVLLINDSQNVSLSGIHFVGAVTASTEELVQSALVMATSCKNIRVENCTFEASPFSGLKLDACSGKVTGNQFLKLGLTAISAFNSRGLEISGNDITDIGDNGIQVWRSKKDEDGTQILNNRISHVRFDSGGDGQNGNGVMVYQAGNVIAANNRISDMAYTGIRFNSTSNSQIIGNSISRTGEKAIYSEFAFDGTVVANNNVDDVAFGISITNFDVGGRLAVCTGNIVRNVRRGKTATADVAWGISGDADTIISSNVVEGVDDAGINLGWSDLCRNLVCTGNMVRDCGRGIAFSTSKGAGKMLIANNLISGASIASIQGMDGFNPTTEDLARDGQTPPANATINNNLVTS
jgi:uncharacterized secreted repeat protein (TIGR03808 family)